VVGHEAPAEDLEAAVVAVVLEEGQVCAAVVVDEEDVLAVVATLSDVVGDVGD